jgi:Ca2+-transporting ATPase
MRRPPRPPNESVFAEGLGVHMIWVGALMAALSIGTQAWAIHAGMPAWQTMVFTVVCFSQLAHVMVIRSERQSLLSLGLLSNRPLLAAVLVTAAVQMAAIYAAPLNRILQTQPLGATDLGLCLAASAVIVVAVEAEKWVKRRAAAGPR